EGTLDQLQIVGVPNACHVPAVTDEPRRYVVAVGERGVAFDGDVVVVIDPAQVGEFQVPRHRRSLSRDSLHHAAVSAQRVDIVIKQVKARSIEITGSPPYRDSHTDTGGHTLPQWASGRFDTCRPAIFGMTGTFAVELAEAFDVFQ